MRLRWVRLLLCVAPVWGAAVIAQRAPTPVHPTTYGSASKKFAWFVDPSDLYGKGPADYVLSKDGHQVWRGRKEYTLYDAVVSDDGKLFGYAYTTGFDPALEDGNFKIVAIGIDGREIVNETTKREGSRFLHDAPNPKAVGVELDGIQNRFSVRILDEDINAQQEEIRSYRVSNGERLERRKKSAGEWKRARQDRKLIPDFKVEDLPKRKLNPIGVTRLKTAPSVPSPIKDVWDMRIDGDGRIGFLRSEGEKAYRFALITDTGQLSFETKLKIPEKLIAVSSPRLAWVQGNRWVVIVSQESENGRARAWWIDVDVKRVTEVSGFDCPSVDQVTADRAGGFVVLAQVQSRYSSEDELSRFDLKGQRLWRNRQGGYSGKPDELLSPEDLVVTRNGSDIAVLDNIRNTVQRFSTDGKFKGLVDLEEKWGREPNYPTEIRADLANGVLIRDFHGEPEIVRMDASGNVRAQFDPKYSDGRRFSLERGIDVAPNGRVWASDGESIVRFTDEGIVDRVLGAAPKDGVLTEVAALFVSDGGEIFAADKRTASVHVFNSSGEQVRICKAAVDDFKEKLGSAEIAVAANGDVFLSDRISQKQFVLFDKSGSRLGVRSFEIDSIHEVLYPRPDGTFLLLGYHDAFLLTNSGDVSKKISRRADGMWLVNPRGGSVAKDGSFAIVSEPGFYRNETWPITLYNSDGEGAKTIVMPSPCRHLAWTGKLLLTRTDEALVGIDVASGETWKTSVEKEWKDAELFAPIGGTEVWLADAKRQMILRLKLERD